MVCATAGCARKAPRVRSEVPYTASAALPTPRIFSPGSISTADPEFGLSFSSDSRTAFFNRMDAGRTRMLTLMSTFADGRWEAGVPVPFTDSLYRDVDVFVAPGGNRIFFSSNRPVLSGSAKDFDTWYVDREGTGWGQPRRLLRPVNEESQDVFVSATRSGTIYFSSDRSGGGDIYRSAATPSGYLSVERISDSVNTAVSESNPLISPDETFLIFSSERPGGRGNSDLYVSHRKNGEWTAPRNLGAQINTSYAEFAPGLSPDLRYLYFTSERPGMVADSITGRRPGDIYQVELGAIPVMR